jgi:hypothetical protein
VSALRVHLPYRGLVLIDQGPQSHVRPVGASYAAGHVVFGRSGDGEHAPRDWAAIKRAQKARRATS